MPRPVKYSTGGYGLRAPLVRARLPVILTSGVCSYGHTIRGPQDLAYEGKTSKAMCAECVRIADLERVAMRDNLYPRGRGLTGGRAR